MALFDPGQPVRRWLLGVAALYGLAVRVRSSWYRRGWLASSSLPRRVVSVGNITVGGTGKTPFVILLAEWLEAESRRVAILSRGYRRTGSSFLLVSDGTRLLAGPSEAGDEPFLLAQRCPRAVVAVGSDRAALGRWVMDQCPVDCFLLDDGFQHRSLRRDVDLVLLDATDATGLDALLPAGRLREPLTALARATSLVITRADSDADVRAIRRRIDSIPGPMTDPIEVVFRPDSLVSLATGAVGPPDDDRGKKAWLVSGIGNSGAFRRSAESSGVAVVGETVFPDHHAYSGEDVRGVVVQARAAGADLVLTTEKDAGKLAGLLGPEHDWRALRIRAVVVRGEERLRKLVRGEG